MYKLVIVEDEENIRHSLENFIPWEEMGFRVLNAFSDGSDALAYLQDNPCDAVLTDILMSRMSGLEMIRRLHQIHPQTKVVILSGHSNFDYAQQAIQYKVAQYLVKPVDEDELIGIFKEIKEQLDEEMEEQALAETQTNDLKQMLMKCFFRDLLSGSVTSDGELGVYLKLLGLQELNQASPLFAFEIHAGEQTEPETVGFSLEALLKEQFPDTDGDWRCFAYEERADKWRQVVIGLEKAAGKQKLQEATKKLTIVFDFHHLLKSLVIVYTECLRNWDKRSSLRIKPVAYCIAVLSNRLDIQIAPLLEIIKLCIAVHGPCSKIKIIESFVDHI